MYFIKKWANFIVKYKKIVCVFAILIVFSIFSSSVLALEPSEKLVYDSHENTEMIWYDEYGNVIGTN